MDDEVIVCDICGDAGLEKLLVICKKCTEGAEHTYCMRVKLHKVPEGDWLCEECRSEFQNSESPVNVESLSNSKVKYKSSQDGKKQTEGVSAPSHSSLERNEVPSDVQSVKKDRPIRMNAEPPVSFKSYNTLQHRDFNKGKAKATNDTSNSQEKAKAKVQHASGDKRRGSTSEVESDKKRMALETRATVATASKPTNQSQPITEPPIKKSGKEKLETTRSVSSVKKSSNGSQEKAKLPSRLSDKSPSGSKTEKARDKCSLLKSGSSKTADVNFKGEPAKVGGLQKRKVEKSIVIHDLTKGKNPAPVSKSVSFNSTSSVKLNGTSSEVTPANTKSAEAFNNSSSAEVTKASKGKDVSELNNSAMCLLPSESGVAATESENRTISRNETSLSGSNNHRLEAVQSSGQLDCQLQPNSHKINEKNKNYESLEAERPIETATPMKLKELCPHLDSDERSPIEAATLSEDFAVPNHDYIWLGKFQINMSEDIASIYVGIQAQLSTYVQQEVLEVVHKLPEILVLEELPRMRIWPSQFMESPATEQNVAIYFFVKDLHSYATQYRGLIEYMSKNDLALKGNLDGVELLIFPSSVLPDKSQCWNNLFFLWGIFGERKIDSSANTPGSNSQKENRDIVSNWAIDLNVDPEDGNDIVSIYEVGEGSYNSGYLELEKTSEGGPWLSDENVGVTPNPNEDVKGKMPITEQDNADDVKLLGNSPINDKNNAHNDEPSLPPVAPTIVEETQDLLHWQAVETLFLISNGF